MDAPQFSPPSDASKPGEFVRLFLAHERRLLAYIVSLLPNLSDAEDVLQEASAVMWEKFGEFEPGSDFAAWSLRIAQLKVFEFRRRRQRGRLVFSDEVLAQVADDAADMGAELERQRQALSDCMKQLTPADRKLIETRYAARSTLKATAAQIGRSVVTARKMLNRIQLALFDCVTKKLKDESSRDRDSREIVK